MTDKNEFMPIIDINIENLPSRGVPYPKGSTLSYRTYTYGEVKSASTSSMTTEKVLRRTLAGLTASFNVMDLTLMDAMYLGIMRKISSFNGMEFELPYVCRQHDCNTENTPNFNHSNLEFKDLSKDVTDLPINVTIGEIDYEFTPITVGDFIDLNTGKYDSLITDKKDPMVIYAMNVKNIAFKEAYSSLSKIQDPDDIELLEDVDRLLLHSMKTLSATCTKCKRESFIKLEGREAFLNPFRGRRKALRHRISFGNAHESKSVPDTVLGNGSRSKSSKKGERALEEG